MIQYSLSKRAALLVAALVLAGSVSAQQSAPTAAKPKAAGKAVTTPFKPVLESKGFDLLKAMSERLAAARAMAFTAMVTYEAPSRLGPALTYTTLSEILMQRPDRLRGET